jgi:coiled-coil domain-containing protein 77
MSAQSQIAYSTASARSVLSSSLVSPSSPPAVNRTVERPPLASLLSPVQSLVSVPTASTDGLTAEQRDLLSYYRTRIELFESERQDFIKRIDELSGNAKERHKLKWALSQRDNQIADLQAALSDAHVFLYQERDRLLSLASENDELKLKQVEDKKRLHHLIALCQPVSQEVTYMRDVRPEAVHRNFAVNRDNIIENQKNLSEQEEKEGEIRRQNLGEKKKNKQTKTNNYNQSSDHSNEVTGNQSRRQAFGSRVTGQAPPHIPSNQRVVRTIFMPNESIEVLNQMIQQLRNQSAEQKALFDQRTRALEEDRTIREAEHKEALSKAHATIQDYKSDIEELNRRNEQTTKDYLALRHEAQASERKLREENAKLSKIGETLKQEYQKSQVEAEKKRAEMNAEHAQYVNLYQRQTSASEEDLAILKAQYAATQDLYEKRIRYLEGRLTTSKSKYQQLEERRNMEFEGYQTDIKSLRSSIKQLESAITKIRTSGISNLIKGNQGQSSDSARAPQRFTQQIDQVEGEVQRLQEEIAKLAQKFSFH